MLKLFCVVVGERGSAFPIDIAARESNGDAWLESDTDDVKKLKKGEKTALIEALIHEDSELQGESGLQKLLKDVPKPSTDEIHVLVVIPEGASGSPAKSVAGSAQDLFEAHRDSTEKWLAKFHTKRIEYHSLPSIVSLPSFIEQPLPVKISMKKKTLFAWSSFPGGVSADVREKIFATDDVAPCKKIKTKIENMLEPLRSGESESSYHWFWDTVFRAVLDVVFTRARMNRDSSKNSSTGNKQPDFLFILNDVCVFRGEEKEPGTNIRLPRDELCQKLAWVYGTVPYIFGYAASGYKIDLFALFRSTSNLPKAESYRIGEFDLELAADRFELCSRC
ncbi:CRN-like protein [Plasmopara halstedii]|uniref:CRN-like protein n=1 Tax=Plasmopara halstedii TaxID=4781 RepID=A0A0P1B5U8_PLAHL|nr:CRN-like protein [Plasmopara halstedii]CEG49436.1 CRN-like protein [Plasmopara halstedii]|eukprot:XP_024585805.1 CRN-like protein [Plasmopara halstedii]